MLPCNAIRIALDASSAGRREARSTFNPNLDDVLALETSRGQFPLQLTPDIDPFEGRWVKKTMILFPRMTALQRWAANSKA